MIENGTTTWRMTDYDFWIYITLRLVRDVENATDNDTNNDYYVWYIRDNIWQMGKNDMNPMKKNANNNEKHDSPMDSSSNTLLMYMKVYWLK